jgi:diguanylate cyclase (GGDEF)-like protein/PAS domain S-box-containing protein
MCSSANFDFHQLFHVSPTPAVLLTPELEIVDANDAFLCLSECTLDELVGTYIFDTFPEPETGETTDASSLHKSFQRVLATREPDTIALQRYPIRRCVIHAIEERFWTSVNTPLFDAVGNLTGICHTTTDVTMLETLNDAADPAAACQRKLEAGHHVECNLFMHAKIVQETNRALEAERARLLHLFDQSPGFVAFMTGPDHVFELCNQAFYTHIGHRDLIGKPAREALPEFADQGYFEILDEVYRTGRPFVGKSLHAWVRQHPEEPLQELYVDLVFQPITDAHGKVTGIVSEGHDITEQKQMETKLRESDERWKFILEGSDDGLWDWDLVSRNVVISDRLREILGYDKNEWLLDQEEYLSRVHPDDRAVVEGCFANIFAGTSGVISSEYRILLKEGMCRWIHCRGKVVSRDANGAPLRVCGTITDISEKKRSEQRIWHQANFDTLTGLPNRSLFREKLEHEVKLAQRTGTPIALFFIDLDRFKEVNDLMGHDMGDILLTHAAQRIANSVRESDTVARLGGDEFTVILPGYGEPADVQVIAQKILDALARPFHLRGELVYISGSIGITLCPFDAEEPEDLLRNADQAMYVAKNSGRNQFSFFTHSMQDAAASRLRLIADLREALVRGQFRLFFQPIVELPGGRIVKAEALLRWFHPDHGLYLPDEFIPLAEETGLIHDIGKWVFTEAAFWSHRWSTQLGKPFQISVNKSPVQFFHSDADEPDHWSHYLAEHGFARNCLSIEITEGLLLNASTSVTERLEHYRKAGIQVALDDFGTGYSSMSYLKKLDIDYLKIDQSFVQDMPHDASSRTIAETMIVMAHRLGLKVVAEGIETEEEKQMLIAAGCDYGQGYLFSKALAPEEMERLLRKDIVISA